MNVSQKAYINQIFAQFKLKDCRRYKTPMISNLYDDLFDHADDEVILGNEYRNMIGSLLFPSQRTRPDMS